MARFDQWFAMERQRDEARHRDLTEDQAWLRLCARGRECGTRMLAASTCWIRSAARCAARPVSNSRRRGLGPGFDNHPEAAWAVASAHQGRGLAAEAMQALLAHHDRSSGRQRVVALIARSNLPSRLAERVWLSRVFRRGVRWCSASAAGTGGLSGGSQPPSAGHRQDFAGDEAGLLGKQEQHGVGDVGRLAQAPQRVLARIVSLNSPPATEAIAVSMRPGATQLMRMPNSATSPAACRVRPTTAFLAVAVRRAGNRGIAQARQRGVHDRPGAPFDHHPATPRAALKSNRQD